MVSMPNLVDPSTVPDFSVIYERSIPVEIRSNQPSLTAGSSPIQPIRAKIAVNELTVKVELTSENDVFFLVSHTVQASNFTDFQERESLTVDFIDYPAVLVKMFNDAIDGLNFVILSNEVKTGFRLEFIQNAGHKFLVLMALDCYEEPPEYVNEQISYRYNLARMLQKRAEQELAEVLAVVKVKTPSLGKQFKVKYGH
jgi:Centriolar protein SAS N-terminal